MNELVIWTPGMTLEAMEKNIIMNAIRFYRGNKAQCAASLGIALRTLENKFERYDADAIREANKAESERLEREQILNRHRGIIPGTESQAGGPRLYGSDAGVHAQPAAQIPAQQQMPMPEQQKVQNVLSEKAPGRRNGRRS